MPARRRFRAAWGGVEHCYVNGRTPAVDDDNFLILNHGQIYSTSIRSVQPVESLAICFKPEMAEQVYNEVSASIKQALARGDAPAELTADFMENLHPHENSVSSVLRFIRAHASRGIVDESALGGYMSPDKLLAALEEHSAQRCIATGILLNIRRRWT